MPSGVQEKMSKGLIPNATPLYRSPSLPSPSPGAFPRRERPGSPGSPGPPGLPASLSFPLLPSAPLSLLGQILSEPLPGAAAVSHTLALKRIHVELAAQQGKQKMTHTVHVTRWNLQGVVLGTNPPSRDSGTTPIPSKRCCSRPRNAEQKLARVERRPGGWSRRRHLPGPEARAGIREP